MNDNDVATVSADNFAANYNGDNAVIIQVKQGEHIKLECESDLTKPHAEVSSDNYFITCKRAN